MVHGDELHILQFQTFSPLKKKRRKKEKGLSTVDYCFSSALWLLNIWLQLEYLLDKSEGFSVWRSFAKSNKGMSVSDRASYRNVSVLPCKFSYDLGGLVLLAMLSIYNEHLKVDYVRYTRKLKRSLALTLWPAQFLFVYEIRYAVIRSIQHTALLHVKL